VRAALITGGSSGIGLAIARMLREEGFELTLSARTQEKLESAAGELDAHAVIANVADEEDCVRLVREHAERFGQLDVLVNSAGVGLGGPIEQMSTKKWDLQLDVNLRGTFIVTRESIPLLRESRGLVVNLASIAGTVPVPMLAAYGASKAGVISLTHSMNRELEDDGIRICALCPGFVDTPMASWTGMSTDEMIQPEDCAEIVRLLLRLSPAARIPQVVVERLGDRP
jgi:NAD(P)-dependent dehydrogenase (short-subunit alcohol dehydrogenase family)